MMLESTEPNMWETGSYKQKDIGVGPMVFPVENPIIRVCFATEIQESVRSISGKSAHLHEEKVLLRICDASSLVMDRLCDWAGKKCCSFQILHRLCCTGRAISNENTEFSLKHIVDGLERIPTKIMIVQAFRDQGKVIGGRELELGKIVEMLQDLTAHLYMR